MVEEPDSVRVQGKSVVEWHEHTLALDERGRAICLIGYSTGDPDARLAFYAPLVGLRTAEARSSFRFLRVHGGRLTRSGFLDDDAWYHIPADTHVRFPAGASSYFGVVRGEDWDEDVELTRQVFGATLEEYQAVASALGAVTGRSGWQYPSITFSKSKENACDLTEAYIPRQFPYVAFEQSQYAWSHVALSGMCTLLAFICPSGDSILRRQLLTQEGVTEELLGRLVQLGSESFGTVTWSEVFR